MPAIVDKSTHFVIRLIHRGCANRPFFHIAVQRNRDPMLGKVRDQLGAYDPMLNLNKEKIVTVDFDRLQYWLNKGAKPSKPVQQLLGLSGFFPVHPTTRLAAFRAQKKAKEAAERKAKEAAEKKELEEAELKDKQEEESAIIEQTETILSSEKTETPPS